MILVKPQSLLNDDRIIRHATGFGEIDGLLRGFLRIVETPKFGTGHAQRIEHGRLISAGEGVGLGRQGKSSVTLFREPLDFHPRPALGPGRLGHGDYPD